MGIVALVDFDRLATAYAAELREEGIAITAPISAAAVLADLARLAGCPEPWFLEAGAVPAPYPTEEVPQWA